MWIGRILVSALSTASSINMTIRLGRLDPNGARQTGYLGIAMSTGILVVLSAGIFLRSDWFARIFTNDAVFLQMFEEARTPFAITLFLMNLAIAVQKIPYSMGRTNEIFWTGFIAGWGGMSQRS
jgi:Na+-driven multidrug efflux pump